MSHTLRVLICGRDEAACARLGRHLEIAGVGYDWIASGRGTPDRLAIANYDAIVFDLILPDQDGISLIQDLRNHGWQVPMLGISLASRPPRSTTALPAAIQLDWLDKAADQARSIFAFKIAAQRRQGFCPRVLSLESDPYSGQLVKDTLGACTELHAAASISEALDHVRRMPFDFLLMDAWYTAEPTQLQTIAATCPRLPLIIHTRYMLDTLTKPAAAPVASLVETIRTYAILGHQLPLTAHA